jgi:hypothetical protein
MCRDPLGWMPDRTLKAVSFLSPSIEVQDVCGGPTPQTRKMHQFRFRVNLRSSFGLDFPPGPLTGIPL